MSFWKKLNSSVLGIFSNDTKKVEDEEIIQVQEVENNTIEVEEKESIKEEVQEEVIEEKVEFISELDRLKQQLPDTFSSLSSMDEYWDAIIALEAVGTSCASSDKDFSNKERKEISKFIHKVHEDIPSSVKEKIDELHQNPLPFNKAFLLANESKIEMSVFEELLDLIIHTDGVKYEEKVVLNAWHDFKKSA